MSDSEGDLFYCVGCGRPVARIKPGQLMGIACSCGANAPILHKEKATVLDYQGWAPPASLFRGTGVFSPHLEYYLGFSDHQSELKTYITQMLRSMGSISYTECNDADCRRSFEHSKETYEYWRKKYDSRKTGD